MPRTSCALSLIAALLASCASTARTTDDRTGTNPAVLRSTIDWSHRVTRLRDDGTAFAWTPAYQHAYAGNTQRVGLSVPVAAQEAGGVGEVGLGDLAARWEWLAHDEDEQATVVSVDMAFDTATERSLGTGRTLFAPALSQVFQLSDTRLLAFSYEQRFSVDSGPEDSLNRGTLRPRFVASNEGFSRWWLIEPSVTVDFQEDLDSWAALAVERGWVLGEVRGAGFSAFVRPEVGVGGHREYDWAMLVGLRVVGL